MAPSNIFGIESSWRDSRKVVINATCLRWLIGIGQRDLYCFAIVDGAWRRDLSSYFRSIAFRERIFPTQSLILFPNNTMATKSVPNALRSAFAAARPRSGSVQTLTRSIRQRSTHQSAKIPAITSSQARHRPILQPHHQPLSPPSSGTSLGTRTIFIQTQSTPNVDVSPSPPEIQLLL